MTGVLEVSDVETIWIGIGVIVTTIVATWALLSRVRSSFRDAVTDVVESHVAPLRDRLQRIETTTDEVNCAVNHVQSGELPLVAKVDRIEATLGDILRRLA